MKIYRQWNANVASTVLFYGWNRSGFNDKIGVKQYVQIFQKFP
jgi:hypothetical protein